MAEPKGKHNPNQKRHRKPAPVQAMSAEDKAALAAAIAKADAEKKAEAERIATFEARVPHMSHRQLSAEIERTLVRKEHVKIGKGLYEPQPGLTIAFGTVLGIVLAGTKTKENPFAKLSCYVR